MKKITLLAPSLTLLSVITLLVLTINVAHAEEDRTMKAYLEIESGYSQQGVVDSDNRKSNRKETFGISEKGYSLSSEYQSVGIRYGLFSEKKPLRFDFSYVYRGYANDTITLSDTKNRHVKVKLDLIELNEYYDMYNSSPITPYVSLSVGMLLNWVSIEDKDLTESQSEPSTVFSMQPSIGAGLGFTVSMGSSFKIDVGAKYAIKNYIDSFLIAGGLSSYRHWDGFLISDYTVGLRYDF